MKSFVELENPFVQSLDEGPFFITLLEATSFVGTAQPGLWSADTLDERHDLFVSTLDAAYFDLSESETVATIGVGPCPFGHQFVSSYHGFCQNSALSSDCCHYRGVKRGQANMKAVIGGLDWPPVGANAMSSDRTITWLVRDCLQHHERGHSLKNLIGTAAAADVGLSGSRAAGHHIGGWGSYSGSRIGGRLSELGTFQKQQGFSAGGEQTYELDE